jgi:hypothetical protein
MELQNYTHKRGFSLHIYEIIWKEQFVSKIESKHKVITEEVEQVLFSDAHFRRA